MANEKQLAFSLKIIGTDREINNIKQLKENLKAADAAFQEAEFGSRQYQVAGEKVQQLKAELFALRKEQEVTQKTFNSLKFPIGSYRQTQAEVAGLTELLRQNVRGVSVTEEQYDKWFKKVEEGKKQLADFDRSLSPSGTLVGEYARGIKQAFEELGVDGFLEKVAAMAEANAGAVEGSLDVMKEQLKLLTELQAKYTQEGTKEYDILMKKIQELGGSVKDIEADTKAAIKANAGLENQLKTLGKVASSIASIGGAAYVAFIDDSEEAELATLKVAKAFTIVQAASKAASLAEEADIVKNIALQKIYNVQKALEGGIESKNILIKYASIAAQRLLNAAVAANPYGLLATAIVTVVGAIITYNAINRETTRLEKQRAAQQKVSTDIDKEAAKSIAENRAQLERLKKTLLDSNLPLEQRKRALSEYNEVADVNNRLTVEEIGNIEKINEKFLEQIKIFDLRAKAKAAESVYTKLLEEQALKQIDESTSKGLDVFEAYGNALSQVFKGNLDALGAFTSPIGLIMVDQQAKAEKAVESQLQLNAAYKAFIESINQLNAAETKSGGNAKEKDKAAPATVNISSELNAREKAGQVILQLLKRQIEERIKAIQDGRAREVQQAEEEYNSLKQALIEQLDEIDGLIDSNRNKRDSIAKDTKLPEAERNKAVKRLDEEYFGLLNERQEAGVLVNQILVQAEENKEKKILAINKKYNDDKLEENAKALQKQLDEFDRSLQIELSKENEARAKGKQSQQQYEDDVYRIKKEALQKKIQLLFLELNQPTSSVGANAPAVKYTKDEVAARLQEYQKLKEELALLEEDQTKKVDEETKKRIAKASGYLQQISTNVGEISSVVQGFGQIQMDTFDRSIELHNSRIQDLEDKISKSSGRQKKIYEQQLKAEKDSMARTEAEKERVRIKYAKAQKAIGIIQATINTALAVMNALATVPYPANLVFAALAAGTGAAQIALIASQPLAKGGNLNEGEISDVRGGAIPHEAGMIAGPSHRSGGVKFKYRGRRYEAEGGELKTNNGSSRYIFTKRVAQDPVLKSIALATHNNSGHPAAKAVGSYINMYAGGRSFGAGTGWLAEGGSLDNAMGSAMAPPVIVTTSSDPQVLQLIASVNENVNQVKMYVDSTNKRIDNLIVAVPVDEINDVQGRQEETKAAIIF